MSPASPLAVPILYSFRRCPYAMRARMAMKVSGIRYVHREVALRDKPEALIAASPKATVPVLVLAEGRVIEQSLDIMQWALQQHDPQHWLATDQATMEAMLDLIAANDGPFKFHLDRMKYATRYVAADHGSHRAEAVKLLQPLQQRLNATQYLFGATPTLADIAIFPFVRQFAHADEQSFSELPMSHLQSWLEHWEASTLFTAIMTKHPAWRLEQDPVYAEG